MKVIVYVEGPSDKLALLVLLNSLLERKLMEGVSIEFFEAPGGDRKASLLNKVPIRAVNILMNDPTAVVIAIPDLYPRNKVFPHETCLELFRGLSANFEHALRQKNLPCDEQLTRRFKIFCFKHDFEALILAAEEALQSQFEGRRLDTKWRKPVEDQNQDYPPKRIVEEIYRQHGQKYKETVDAPLIMRGVAYQQIAERCPQCFKPLVDFLENIQDN